jgi:hypothetical protein
VDGVTDLARGNLVRRTHSVERLQWSCCALSEGSIRVNVEKSRANLHYVEPPPRSLPFENPSLAEHAVHR